jgi:hypothetical protein
MRAGHIRIDMQYHEWRFDGEVINQLAGFGLSGVREGTPWARGTHPLDVQIPAGSIVSKLQAMQCTVRIEVSAYRICVEGDKQYVVEFLRHEL